MQSITCETLDKAWEYWYNNLTSDMKELESRDGDVVGEVIDAVTIITDPTRNIMKNPIRNLSIRYAVGELLWYLSGNPNLKEIQKYTHGWDRMSDDGITVNSNYGWYILNQYGFNQWEYVKNLLVKDPNSRQAVIHYKFASDTPSKDVTCTVFSQFFIRNNKLYMTTHMRSNDLWMGFPYDIFQFTCMQILMSMELGLDLGTYTHIAGSLHLYKRDFERSKKYEN